MPAESQHLRHAFLASSKGIASPLVRRCSPLSLVVLHRPEPQRCSANRAGGVVIDSADPELPPVRVFVDDAVVRLGKLVGPENDGAG